VELSNTIVQLTVPGRDGNIIQNLGSGSRKINLGGTFGIQDYDVWEFEKQIITLLRAKSPVQVTFPIVLNDIGTNVTMCVVESIKFDDQAARLNMIDYHITLVEWRDASVEKVGVNLVNSGPVSQFISVLQRRRVGVPTNWK
jgi:hypothetical protein